EDLREVYYASAGLDGRDGTTFDIEANRDRGAPERPRVGLAKQAFSEGVEPAVSKRLLDVADRLKSLGCSVEEVDLPYFDKCLPAYYLIAMSEASTNLARFDGVRYGVHPTFQNGWEEEYPLVRSLFGQEVKRRILMGAFALSAGFYDMYYDAAARFRTLLIQAYDRVFGKFDALLLPTAATPAFRLGERMLDPLTMYLTDVFTVPANLVGAPALSVPCGTTAYQGCTLPLAVQFMAQRKGEPTLFRLAKMLEDAKVAECVSVDPWGRPV
ncbi:MAG: amidase family protein, partial [Thermoprotei archaeon]